ncbi:hypothetical protein BDR07DRAFT_1382892 [Suillus spraguei]|nr:hypothetical protein BDR07DRAFT_1382892 [Suillus spraguei]
MSLFNLGSDLCPEAVALVEKFATIHTKVEALTKCIPEDREDLAAEKKHLALVLPPAENAAGLEASKMYDRWTEQVRAALFAMKIKREQEKLATAADEKGKEKEVAVVDVPMKEVTGGDAEGTAVPLASTKGTLHPKPRPRIGRRAGDIVYSKPYTSVCKAKTAAKTLPTAGDSGSGKAGSEVTAGGPPEVAIELTEGEEMDMGEVARQVTEDSDVEDEAEFQRQLDELRTIPDLFFLTDAEMQKLDVRYVQMQGLMKEMAASMKYLHGYLDRIKKRMHMSLSPVVVPPVRQIRVNERSRKMRLE